MEIMVGIYKITSPSGKVYIGQSVNIKRRWSEHKKPSGGCSHLSASMKKHGQEKHIFSVLTELPEDVSQLVLNNYESVYIGLYVDAGVRLMNIREAGSKGRLHPDTKNKLSKIFSGRKTGLKMPEYLRVIHSQRMSKKNLGNKLGQANKGRRFAHTAETKNKQSKAAQTHVWEIFKAGQLLGVFDDSKLASKATGIPASTIKRLKNHPCNSRSGIKVNAYERNIN